MVFGNLNNLEIVENIVKLFIFETKKMSIKYFNAQISKIFILDSSPNYFFQFNSKKSKKKQNKNFFSPFKVQSNTVSSNTQIQK